MSLLTAGFFFSNTEAIKNMLMVCAAPAHKTAVQNYAAANGNAYFLHKRFSLKPEFNCADTRTE